MMNDDYFLFLDGPPRLSLSKGRTINGADSDIDILRQHGFLAYVLLMSYVYIRMTSVF